MICIKLSLPIELIRMHFLARPCRLNNHPHPREDTFVLIKTRFIMTDKQYPLEASNLPPLRPTPSINSCCQKNNIYFTISDARSERNCESCSQLDLLLCQQIRRMKIFLVASICFNRWSSPQSPSTFNNSFN